MLSPTSSQRIKYLRFPLIIGVVFIHAYKTTIGTIQNDFVVDFIRNLVSEGFARVAVPLFFLMSGYLFFTGFDVSRDQYFAKVRSRIRTLLIPFLFWNMLALALVATAQAIPALQTYFSVKNEPVATYTLADYFIVILGIGRDPIAYQFWFIRDLMLLVLFAPIIAVLTNKIKILSFMVSIGLFVCWFLGVWALYSPSVEATLFFFLGSYLALNKKDLFFLDQVFESGYLTVIAAIYLLIVIIHALYINEPFSLYLHKAGVMIGVATALFLTKLIPAESNLKYALIDLSDASFFIFAAHEPFLTILRKVVFKIVVPNTSFMILLLYFLIPIGVVAALVVGYKLLFKYFPQFLYALAGGRRNDTSAS